jgi:uncharacterized membrane protein
MLDAVDSHCAASQNSQRKVPRALQSIPAQGSAAVYLIDNPALARESWQHALSAGALFGLVCYATYDLTNLATVKDWPALVTVVDLIWGTFVSAATSVLSYLVIQLLR